MSLDREELREIENRKFAEARARERREAWDRYAAAVLSLPKRTASHSANCADSLLAERDKRFPKS